MEMVSFDENNKQVNISKIIFAKKFGKHWKSDGIKRIPILIIKYEISPNLCSSLSWLGEKR